VSAAAFPADVLRRAAAVSLVSFDVDGVLTDGRIVYSDAGHEIKAFHVQDGSAIKLLQSHGVRCAVVTGRQSAVVTRRAGELGIEHVHQGVADKARALDAILDALGLDATGAAHIGDDLPDIPAFDKVGLAVGVADGHPAALARTHYVTHLAGGQGVAREICELILRARGAWPYGP